MLKILNILDLYHGQNKIKYVGLQMVTKLFEYSKMSNKVGIEPIFVSGSNSDREIIGTLN